MYKIDKGIKCDKKVTPRYPFDQMDVGDSFYLMAQEESQARNAATNYGVRRGMKFSVKKWEAGYRCWRTK